MSPSWHILSALPKILHLCNNLGVLSILFKCLPDLVLFFMPWMFLLRLLCHPPRFSNSALCSFDLFMLLIFTFCRHQYFFSPISWNLCKEQQINVNILTLSLTDWMQKNRFLEEKIGSGKNHRTDQMGLFRWNLSYFW